MICLAWLGLAWLGLAWLGLWLCWVSLSPLIAWPASVNHTSVNVSVSLDQSSYRPGVLLFDSPPSLYTFSASCSDQLQAQIIDITLPGLYFGQQRGLGQGMAGHPLMVQLNLDGFSTSPQA